MDNQPHYFLNRELSVLQFNYRVLAQAKDTAVPLLERLRFLFICSANLDEFFEIRVAALKHQLEFGAPKTTMEGTSVVDLLQEISQVTHAMVDELYQVFNHELLPALAKEEIWLRDAKDWSEKQAAWIKQYFRKEIMPLLSPIGLDLAHPFPRLVNKSLNYLVSLTGKDAFGRASGLAVVHAPRSLPRVIRLPDELCAEGENYVLLNSIIYAHASELFGGMSVTGCYQFRITRNSAVLLEAEENIEDLALALKNELFSRRYGAAVRLEIAADCPDALAVFLLAKHKLTENELYRVAGPVNLSRFRIMLELTQQTQLLFPAFIPGIPERLKDQHDYFEAIRNSDILLYHPYQTFAPVIDFVQQAALDPDVIVIKQTLYRIEQDSPMVKALIDAARAGKQVTAVVELRARFDEEQNIEFASRLQEAGVLVVYGVVGFKTHAKMVLVVRREGKTLRRYVHLGTGNYHAGTARLYTDIGLLTNNQEFTNDVHEVFQQLTGMGRASKLKKLLQSPFTLQKAMLGCIQNETANATAGKAARIIAKMNALTEPTIINALYEASQAGVKIDLIIRGMCCLRPGIKGVSENIRVRSIVGRFLEHSRAYYFLNDGDEKIYCSSADWMERNLFRRVEVCFPIEDKQLAQIVKEEVLQLYWQDNTQSWELHCDGSYKRLQPGNKPAINAQQVLLERYT